MPRNKSWFFSHNRYTANLPLNARAELDANSQTMEFSKKQSIWVPGHPASHVYFVRSGMVKIAKASENGRSLTLHLVQPKEIFGECSLASIKFHHTSASAFEESVVYAYPADDFLALMRKYRSLSDAVTLLIADRRRSLENRIQGLLFQSAHARLASLFLELSQRFGVRDARGIIINVKTTHRELASLVGTSRETVSFAIKDLRSDGLILTEDKRVVLLDLPRLKELATV